MTNIRPASDAALCCGPFHCIKYVRTHLGLADVRAVHMHPLPDVIHIDHEKARLLQISGALVVGVDPVVRGKTGAPRNQQLRRSQEIRIALTAAI